MVYSLLFGKFTPVKIQLECTLYHGCEVLTEGVLSSEVYFNNTLHFDQWITFGNLRVRNTPQLIFHIVLPNPDEDPCVLQPKPPD